MHWRNRMAANAAKQLSSKASEIKVSELTLEQLHFGVTEMESLKGVVSPYHVAPQTHKTQNILEDQISQVYGKQSSTTWYLPNIMVTIGLHLLENQFLALISWKRTVTKRKYNFRIHYFASGKISPDSH